MPAATIPNWPVCRNCCSMFSPTPHSTPTLLFVNVCISILQSIGASLALKKWNNFNIAFWDTAGEERYATLSSFYCRGASVAVLAFDITNRESFIKLTQVFIPMLEEASGTCLTIVVGTKVDLATNKRQVKCEEGVALAAEQHEKQKSRALAQDPNSFLRHVNGKQLYFETSAKVDTGVTELFDAIQKIVLSQLEKNVQPKTKTKDSIVHVESTDNGGGRRSCCSHH